MRQQLIRWPAGQACRTEPVLAIDVPPCVLLHQLCSNVAQDDDREFQSLGPTERHQPHAFGAFLEKQPAGKGGLFEVRTLRNWGARYNAEKARSARKYSR